MVPELCINLGSRGLIESLLYSPTLQQQHTLQQSLPKVIMVYTTGAFHVSLIPPDYEYKTIFYSSSISTHGPFTRILQKSASSPAPIHTCIAAHDSLKCTRKKEAAAARSKGSRRAHMLYTRASGERKSDEEEENESSALSPVSDCIKIRGPRT